jgi:SAM-dependent methyltransferase
MSIAPQTFIVSAATWLPGLRRLSGRRTGGSTSARYCYSVWLRHLVTLRHSGLPPTFDTVVELGPGDSLGLGLAALLCGAGRYLALDVVRYAECARNLQVFDELVALFSSRADIPDQTEFPRIQPALGSYAFPAGILTSERLGASLKPARLEAIRSSISRLSEHEAEVGMLSYHVPWHASSVASGSADLVLSQSVLEYSPDLRAVYIEMARWLRPGGVMSHEIDFKSLGLTREWNGHWACPDRLWRVAVGNRRHRPNREPCSTHVELAQAAGCRVVSIERTRRPSDITRAQLTRRFQRITDDDLTTSSALIQAVKSA